MTAPAPKPSGRLPTTAAQLSALPTILLVAPQRCGKTETLNRWRSRLSIQRARRREDGIDVYESEPEYRAKATDQVSEWILVLPSGPPIRIVDVPGEVVRPRRYHDATGDDAGERAVQRYRAALQEILRGASLIGIVLFARPPASEAPERGRVHDVARYRQVLGEAPPGIEEARHVLLDSHEFVDDLLSRCDHDPRRLAWAVQVGFADLVAFGGDDDRDTRARGWIAKVYRELAGLLPAGRTSLEANGRRRLDLCGRLDVGCRQVFGELIAPLDEVLPTRPFVYVQSSIEQDDLRFGPAHRVTGLVWLLDQWRAGLARSAWRKRLLGLVTMAAAAAAIAGLLAGLLAVVGGGQPARTALAAAGPAAAWACESLARSGRGWCGCLPVLAADDGAQSLALRVGAAMPHVEACERAPAVDPAVMPALISWELARALVDPEAFCTSRLPKATWSMADETHIGVPLRTPAEVAFGQWLLARVHGESAGTKALREALADAGAYKSAAARLARARSANECLSTWGQARAGKAKWSAAHKACRTKSTWASLDPGLREAFAADAPPFAGSRLVPLPERVTLAPASSACRDGESLDDLVSSAPAPDGVTAANLAAMATDATVYAAWMGRATDLEPVHRSWMDLTAPGLAIEERQARLAAIDMTALARLFSRPWIAAETGEGFHSPGDRAPRLRVADAAALACTLVTPLAAESPDLSAIGENVAETRSRETVAAALLAAAPDPTNPEWLRCAAASDLQLVRGQPDREAALRSELDALARLDPAAASAAAVLDCHVAAELSGADTIAPALDRLEGVAPEAMGRCALRAAVRLAATGPAAVLEEILGRGLLPPEDIVDIWQAAGAAGACRAALDASVDASASADVRRAAGALSARHPEPDLASALAQLGAACP